MPPPSTASPVTSASAQPTTPTGVPAGPPAGPPAHPTVAQAALAPVRSKPGPAKRRISVMHYDTVSLLLISMVPYSEIEKQMSMAWSRQRSYVRGVIKQVMEDWEANAALLVDKRRGQVRGAWEALYNKCVAKGDLNAAAKCMTEIGKLDGCYAPEQVNLNHTHQGNVGVGISLGSLGFKSADDVRDRIEYLRGQVAEQGASALVGGQVSAVAQAQLHGRTPDNNALPVIDVPDPDQGGTP